MSYVSVICEEIYDIMNAIQHNKRKVEAKFDDTKKTIAESHKSTNSHGKDLICLLICLEKAFWEMRKEKGSF